MNALNLLKPCNIVTHCDLLWVKFSHHCAITFI